MGKNNKIVILAVGALAAAGIAAFVLFGPPQMLAKTSTPDFCVSCHVMESEYQAWSHAGAHRRKICVDCHLPNENKAVHLVWKTLDGLKDVALFYSGRVPERIQLTEHGKEVVQANCIRCHEATVAMIREDRPCWTCHRRIAHRNTGTIASVQAP